MQGFNIQATRRLHLSLSIGASLSLTGPLLSLSFASKSKEIGLAIRCLEVLYSSCELLRQIRDLDVHHVLAWRTAYTARRYSWFFLSNFRRTLPRSSNLKSLVRSSRRQ